MYTTSIKGWLQMEITNRRQKRNKRKKKKGKNTNTFNYNNDYWNNYDCNYIEISSIN